MGFPYQAEDQIATYHSLIYMSGFVIAADRQGTGSPCYRNLLLEQPRLVLMVLVREEFQTRPSGQSSCGRLLDS